VRPWVLTNEALVSYSVVKLVLLVHDNDVITLFCGREREEFYAD